MLLYQENPSLFFRQFDDEWYDDCSSPCIQKLRKFALLNVSHV